MLVHTFAKATDYILGLVLQFGVLQFLLVLNTYFQFLNLGGGFVFNIYTHAHT